MFGTYNTGSEINSGDIALSIRSKDESLFYSRVCAGETFEKTILTDPARIIINPVEPVNKPRAVSNYLLLKPVSSVLIGPGESRKIYLKFPVETGVFLEGSKKSRIIDIFSLNRSKYTLYGEPRGGVICRYWESEIYHSIPEANPLLEGVTELKIINNHEDWLELTRAVFNAYNMKIFYDSSLVSMKSEIQITNSKVASTYFLNEPFRSGMKSSLEIYRSKGFVQTSHSFIMEYGI